MVKRSENAEQVHHYLVVGRRNPDVKGKKTGRGKNDATIYKMRVFARNPVLARSKFWYFLRKLNKLKKANGEILACHEVNKQLI